MNVPEPVETIQGVVSGDSDVELESKSETVPVAAQTKSNSGFLKTIPDVVSGNLNSINRTIQEVVLKNAENDQSILIDVKVAGAQTTAVIDTAAQVTVISEDFVKNLTKPLRYVKDVCLKGAGKEQFFSAKLAREVQIKIGKRTINWDLYVAPITDSVILGLDFLRFIGAKINQESNTVKVGDRVIKAHLKRVGNEELYQVSRVSATKRYVVPPHAVAFVPCTLKNPIVGDFMVYPDYAANKLQKRLLVPHAIYNGRNIKVCFLMILIGSQP